MATPRVDEDGPLVHGLHVVQIQRARVSQKNIIKTLQPKKLRVKITVPNSGAPVGPLSTELNALVKKPMGFNTDFNAVVEETMVLVQNSML